MDDGSRVVQQTVGIHSSHLHNIRHESMEIFDRFYQIEETVDLILKFGFRRVALQFPDYLIADSARVSYRIQYFFNMRIGSTQSLLNNNNNNSIEGKALDTDAHRVTTSNISDIEDMGFEANINHFLLSAFEPKQLSNNSQLKLYILGDTSYGSCCIDEIAAQHVDSEFIVHYGNACLQRVKRSPLLHVFGRNYNLNIDKCFTSLYDYAMANKDTTIVVLYDLMNSYSILLLKEKCQKKSVNNIMFGVLNEERVIQNMPKELDDNSQQGSNSTNDSTSVVTFEVNGLLFSVPYQHKDTFKFFFIGEDSTQLTQIIMDFNSHQFVIFSHLRNELDDSGDSASRINRILKRRYYLVQLAKEAQVIGIIVATVSVENYLTILAYVKKLIVDTGKKFYVFFVGKINVPKLANFAEIDIFCLISCAQNSLIDSKEFLKPIITPFELELALKKDKEWTNEYISDFNKLLELNRHNLPANNISESERKEDEYDYSFITGSIRRSTKSTASSSNLTDADGFSNELVHIDPSRQQLSLSEMTPSMLYLQSRTYKGLEQNNDETPIATIEEGRSGIAMSYTHEK